MKKITLDNEMLEIVGEIMKEDITCATIHDLIYLSPQELLLTDDFVKYLKLIQPLISTLINKELL